jgi:hypothetical protein
MTTYQLRQSAGTLMLLAILAPGMGFAQPSLDSSADRLREIVERIEQEESQNGPFSEALIGPLTALVLFYQEEGDHLSTIATVERVRQVVRANYGLHSLEQAPLIRQSIASAKAIGSIETAWALEQELLALARRHPDDLRTVPIFREAADSRTAVLRRYLSGEFPPEILLGCYYDFGEKEDCNSGTRSGVIESLSLDAQRNYADAISAILRNEHYSSDELRELEMSVVRNADLARRYGQGQRGRRELSVLHRRNPAQFHMHEREELSSLAPNTVAVGGRSYLMGRMSLERLVAYEYKVAHESEAKPDSWFNLAAALVRVADWDLLYSLNQSALEEYELAYQMLQSADTTQSVIDELFSPDSPVALPTFGPPLSPSQEAEPSTGYVDVAFEITKFGKSRRVEILDSTMSASPDAEKELIRTIKETTFRPRVVNGQFGDTSRVTARYQSNE